MTLKNGEVLHNRYRVDKLLAQGGFGTLYKSWDLALGRDCVLKENISNSADSQRQFLREAKILSNLSHPNLPRVTDYFLGMRGDQIFVMDYVEGKDLQNFLEEQGTPIPEDKAVEWAKQICDALTYLHSQKPAVIHRDVKPANIRINPNGTAVLIDFGIAKVFDTQTNTTVGAQAVSPGYSPYEQYGKGKTDQRSDIYALGATLYTLLTGQEPPESIQRVVNDPLVPPRQVIPNLSIRISAAVVRAMQIDPTMRFQSAGEFKLALSVPPPVRFSQGVAVSYAGLPQLRPSSAAAPSKPWRWIALVVVLLVVIVGLLVKVMNANGERFQYDLFATSSNNQVVISQNPTRFITELTGTSEQVAVSEVRTPTLTPLVYLVQVGDTCSEIALSFGLEIDEIVAENQDLEPDCGFLYSGQILMIPQVNGPIDTPEFIRSPTPELELVTRVSHIDGMEMVYIPAGEFTMGAEAGDLAAREFEKPSRDVYLDAYWIDMTEISNGMYQKCVDQGSCAKPENPKSKTREEYFGNPDYFNYPVVNISWEEAKNYCLFTGRRLPSEAEWEKAARGEDGRIFPWGNQAPSLKYANFGGLLADTDTVGAFPFGASPYGLLDMAGNVAEWVADWYQSDYYHAAPYKNPPGPQKGEYRMIRGGSWFNPEYVIRSSFRLWNYPNIRSEMIGFRCAEDQ